MQGVAHTQYQRKGVTFTRDLLVSKPDEVIALNLKADKPGALSFTAALVRKHDAATRADGGVYVLEGQLPFNKPGGGGEGMRYIGPAGRERQGRQGFRHGSRFGRRGRRRSDAHRVGRHGLEGQGVCQARAAASRRGPGQTVRRPPGRRGCRPPPLHGSLPVDPAGGAELQAAHARAREGAGEDPRPGPGGALLPVRPPPGRLRLAARLAVADQLAGHLGRGIRHALARRLPQQHQPANELLAGGTGQPVRLPSAAVAVHPERGQGRPEDGQGVLQRPRLDGQPHAEPVVRHRAELPARLHRADLRRMARPAHLAALRLHAGQGVPARILPRAARRQPVHAGRAGRESQDPRAGDRALQLAGEQLRLHRSATASGRRPRCAWARPSTSRSPAIC